MADKLLEIFNAWRATKPEPPTELQLFQGGFTAGAVSLRERAIKTAQNPALTHNDVINKIGALPDIPDS